MSNLGPECIECNVCSDRGLLAEATDVGSVASNVREFQHESFTVWRCRKCGTLHSKEAVDLDHYYANYVVKNQKLGFFVRTSFRQRVKWLTACGVTKHSHLLEYGCGNGLFVDYLRKQGYKNVRGYDRFVPQHSDEAWRNEKFDAMTSYAVIEHVNDPRAFLTEQANQLRPGGVLLVGAPDATGIQLQPTDAINLHQPYHRHILSLRALVELGNSLGLEVVRTTKHCWTDTRIPFVNRRFLSSYVYATGNLLDVVFEKPRLATILTSPKLLFHAYFGYYLTATSHMQVCFRKP